MAIAPCPFASRRIRRISQASRRCAPSFFSRETTESGTVGRSVASLELSDAEADDLSRYLDVMRAEMLFARGVILVEGDAERFLVPVFAQAIEKPLDHLGITVCSVAGMNFIPYAKFLTGLGIPFSIITGWDPRQIKKPLGYNRSLNLAVAIERIRTGEPAAGLITELKGLEDYDDFCGRCEEYGIYSNGHTLEIDLFEEGFGEAIIETLREGKFGTDRTAWVDEWEADPEKLHKARFLSLIDEMGKGGFAQRLASRIDGLEPPYYIAEAIKYVADRV